MNEAQLAAQHKDLWIMITVVGMVTYGFLITALYHLGKILSKLDLVLRKLNNSQPDDEGGY